MGPSTHDERDSQCLHKTNLSIVVTVQGSHLSTAASLPWSNGIMYSRTCQQWSLYKAQPPVYSSHLLPSGQMPLSHDIAQTYQSLLTNVRCTLRIPHASQYCHNPVIPTIPIISHERDAHSHMPWSKMGQRGSRQTGPLLPSALYQGQHRELQFSDEPRNQHGENLNNHS